ncbi:MAG TPA: SdrD B-like domain-containing protein [Tepidisphaeraceae bacterium]|jgi:hypothetical protein|nr:SdrD B-like domain-containing protein [Tepidisphaeraceae bacterium]
MKDTASKSTRKLTKLRKAISTMMEPLDPRLLFAGVGNLHVTVINDLNGNGVQEAGEPPLAGWNVYLDLNKDGVHQSTEPMTATDSTGQVTFSSIDAITYDVVEILPPGWSPSPAFKTLDHASVKNGKTTETLFLNVSGNGSIQGTIWNDINGDGVHDATDPGLAGWTVFIDQNNNRILDAGETSVTSDANGLYSMPDLAPGSYQIREIVQPNWNLTLGVDNGVGVKVSSNHASVLDFGNFNPNFLGAINGNVWNDVNADGIRAVGDPGLAGWTVYLDLNGNSVLDSTEPSTITDALGSFSFPALTVGTYHVATIVQDGWNPSPGHPSSVDVTVTGGRTANVQFPVFTPTLGSISGEVWNDLDGNGFIGTGEPGIQGWTVFLDQNSNGMLDDGEPSTLTDADGNYSFSDVPVGATKVVELPAVGWTPTAPATAVHFITIPNGTAVPQINFGNKQRTNGGISGAAFVDSNGNGVLDAGEKGLAGIPVYLDLNDNGVLDAGEPQTITSADLFFTPAVNEAGTYSFPHLGAGTYHVREVTPTILSGTPNAAQEQVVNLLTGETRTNVNFADQFRPNEIHGIIYNDVNHNHIRDAGELGVGGVTVYVDLNRNNVYDAGEPKTVTASDGSYAFTTGIAPGSYVVREMPFVGDAETYPTTLDGILWPTGVSNPAVGDVSPTSITTSLADEQTEHDTVSLTLPSTGSITNEVDVFLLFDDTGSFTSNSPIVRAAFPQIISSLQAALPGTDLAFGVGRFEEYANFASEFPTGRPFILNQPIVDQDTPGFSASIQSALDRTAPGFGGDTPETDIEALYQTATGVGFDGNNNGTTTDSGAAGLVNTQLSPGDSGDVPAFGSFTVDPSGNVLPAAGSLGGAGFRPGALPIILLATDTGLAYQPQGETSVTGLNGLTLPISAFQQTSRPTTPFNSGAGIQQTITALNALGALVIGLGTNAETNIDPRQDLEAIAKLTGAINKTTVTIPNGTTTPIAPGDPLYFQIASGFGASVANGVVDAIEGAATGVAVNIALKASDPTVHISNEPGVVDDIGPGQTATFDVEFEGDGAPHRFDLQFVREGTNVVLGSIPVVIGTPIAGNGYEFEDIEEGQIEDTADFGDSDDLSDTSNIVPSFNAGADQSVSEDDGAQSVAGWASGISAGPASEASQLLDFDVSNDNQSLFSAQPTINVDGTLSYTPAPGASGSATVTVDLHDNGGTVHGGADTSAATIFTINIQPAALSVTSAFDYLSGQALTLDFSHNLAGGLPPSAIQLVDLATGLPVAMPDPVYDPATHRATVNFDRAKLLDGDYRLTIAAGALPNMATPTQFDFFVLAGDANHDHFVNVMDFNTLAMHFGQSGMDFSDGDFNYDGVVNLLDLNAIATRFGTGPAAAVIPSAASPSAPAGVAVVPAASAKGSLFGDVAVTSTLSDVLQPQAASVLA